MAKGRDARLAANWITGDFFAALNRTGTTIETSPVSATALGELIDLITDKTSRKDRERRVRGDGGNRENARRDHRGKRPAQVTDTGAIEAAVDAVLAANQDKVAEYKSGKEKLFGFFVGQVMKATAGKATRRWSTEIIKRKL